MTKKTKAPPRPPRTTVPLTGTTTKTQAALSFPAAFALEYAQVWLTRAGSLRVPTAGLLRRALLVYADHLHTQAQQEATGPAVEVRAVHRACSASQVEHAEQQLAQLRLHTCPPGEPLPALQDLLMGPQRLTEMQAMEDRVETICAGIFSSRSFKLNAAKSAKRQALASAPTTTTTHPAQQATP